MLWQAEFLSDRHMDRQTAQLPKAHEQLVWGLKIHALDPFQAPQISCQTQIKDACPSFMISLKPRNLGLLEWGYMTHQLNTIIKLLKCLHIDYTTILSFMCINGSDSTMRNSSVELKSFIKDKHWNICCTLKPFTFKGRLHAKQWFTWLQIMNDYILRAYCKQL